MPYLKATEALEVQKTDTPLKEKDEKENEKDGKKELEGKTEDKKEEKEDGETEKSEDKEGAKEEKMETDTEKVTWTTTSIS